MNLKQVKQNQTELTLNDGRIVFFSYNTPVAYLKGSHGFRTEKFYSVTTKKHIGQFFDRHFINNVTEVFQDDIDAMVK